MHKRFINRSAAIIVGITVSLITITSFHLPVNKKLQVNNLVIKSVDPLIKVTPELNSDVAETVQYTYARGEEVHVQIVVWNKDKIENFSIKGYSTILKAEQKLNIQKVGYVSIKEKAVDIDNRIQSASNQYPDPLFYNGGASKIDKNSVMSFWISLKLPANINPGAYDLKLICAGTIGIGSSLNLTKNIKLTVTNASVNKRNYPWFANWIIVDIPSLGPGMKKLKYINANKDVTPFDNNYWNKISLVASFMRSTGQNVYMLSPQRLAKYSYNGDDLQIDFGRFDSMLNCYTKNKIIGRIDGWQICSRPGSFESNFVVHYIKKDSLGKAVFANGQPEDAAVQKFYKAYLPALISHLKSLNLYNIYYQHIADEPIDANADSYIRIIKMIKSIAPDLKTLEPIQTTKVAEYLDIPIPSLDYLDKHSDYFENLVKQGKEVWMYTAFMPQNTYANRFIEQQALQHRLLFWILAKYNLKGMLNWGFDYWETNDPYNDLGKKSGQFILPAGDGYLVYPKDDHLISSIRLETMKDGLNDYALLMQLKQKNPQLAQKLTNQVVQNYKTYMTDINAFRKVRSTLLASL
jgi:hypothetical protein